MILNEYETIYIARPDLTEDVMTKITTRFEAVINLVRPRAHLNNTNEVRLQCRFLIQSGQKSWKMIANKMRLRASGCVKCGQSKPTNVLQQGCHYFDSESRPYRLTRSSSSISDKKSRMCGAITSS